MSEAGNRARQKSRAPYFLVAAVFVVVIVAAILSNRFKADGTVTSTPSAIQADQATTAIGTPPPRAGGDSVAERTAAMAASRQDRRADRKQKLQEARLATARRFELEVVDPAWAAGKETRLQALAESPTYEQVGIVPTSLQIDCRSTLCKVTANHASYGASADWSMIYMTSSAGEIKRTYTRTVNNPDGTTSVEIYAEAR